MKSKVDKAFEFRNEEISMRIAQKDQMIRYEYGVDQYIQLGYFRANAHGGSRRTMSWNKYGARSDKN